MKLDNNYTITAEHYNTVLRYEHIGGINPKTGKPTVSKNEWYYKSLEDALNAYIGKTANVNGEVQDVLESIENAKQMVKEALEQ